ncbi:MAG: DUF645 family protein [Deltaproteobacteria bacterium]|nr:DUF645 family protein [Deltaproteobacteria bacterium]MBT5485650.1 DUF645 family protein [Deltaproteobacteria bacterium]
MQSHILHRAQLALHTFQFRMITSQLFSFLI